MATAEVNLKSLTEVSSVPSSSNLLLFDEGTNVASRIDYDALADAILNKLTTKTYSGINSQDIITTLTNLVGSQAQSVPSGTNLNTLTNTGIYQIGDLSQMTNGPLSSGYGTLEVLKSRSYIHQRFTYISSTTGSVEYNRVSANSGSTWKAWTCTSDDIIMRSVSATIPANAGNVNVTATSVSGYTFIGWVYAASQGWVGPIYPASNSATTAFYTPATAGTARNFNAFYLLKRS